MAGLIESILQKYNYIFYDLADERTKYMFPSPTFTMVIIPFYLYFSTNLGPRLMQDVKPFKLRTTIIVYNITQIILCSYTLYLGLTGGWLTSYTYWCQPLDMTENPKSRTMINAVWWYTVLKLIDFLDTVFFVLRKKERQISTLHVYHHAVMPIISYIALKYFATGHGTYIGLMNCFVHIIMYTYYLIAGLGPKYQKYLWWKKYLTILQLVQFVSGTIHNLVAFLDSSCTYPKWINVLCVFQGIHFMYMFGTFYYENYVKTSKSKANNRVNVTTEKSKVH